MAGPWEQYQSRESDGPWAQYGGTAVAEPSVMSRAVETAAGLMPRRTAAVGVNAAMKGLAGIPDMFLNAPANFYNLGASGVGVASDVAGRPDITANIPIVEPPNLVHRAMQAVGAISPEREPQTGMERVADLAIQAGTGAALAPGSLGRNIATGLASGGAAGVTKEATGSDLAALAVGLATPLATRAIGNIGRTAQAPNPVLAETLAEGRKAGYVIPPATIKPTGVTKSLESIGGKAATGQEAALRNQTVTNKLAAKAIGLSDETTITPAILKDVREKAAAPYREIEKLRSSPDMEWYPRFHETNLLEQLKQARANATQWFRAYDRSAHPEDLAKAKSFTTLASSIEADMEKIAVSAGKPELVKQLASTRKLFAKTYDVERALNVADGNVSAPIIGRLLDQGKPLSGELRVIGRFAQAFPSVSREGASVPQPGVSATNAAASAMLGMEGYGLAGPRGMLAAGLPLLRGPVRSGILSNRYQNQVLQPMSPLDEAAMRSLLAGRAIATSVNPED